MNEKVERGVEILSSCEYRQRQWAESSISFRSTSSLLWNHIFINRKMIKLLLLILSPSLQLCATDNNTRRYRRATFADQYYQYQQWNLLVLSESPDDRMQQFLIDEHNRFRRMIPATDMHMLHWNNELASTAQRHANRCDFGHSRDRQNVGENIWAAPFSNYSEAVERWFREVYDTSCACQHAYKHCCGHYVQVVWAATTSVGCGFSRCRDIIGVRGRGHRNILVCHYRPQGNTIYIGSNGQIYAEPAFTWTNETRSRCSDCSPDAATCIDGLCT